MTSCEELASLPLQDRISAVIDASGLGQEGFADRLGAPRETVNRWANGHVRPGRSYRQKIAELAEEFCGKPVSPDAFREGRGRSAAPEDVAALRAEVAALNARVERILELLLGRDVPPAA